MARYKLIGNELVDITNKNKTNSTPTPYKIAQNKDKMLTQINHRKTNDSTTMYKIENEFKLRNEVNKNRRKYIDNKNILADTLNNQGLNVNRNNPFQANVNSNNLINNSRTNLNGIVTLNDVVNNQKKVLENNKELVNNVNNSMSDYAKSNYLYNKQKVDNDNVSLYDKTLGTAVRGVSDLFSNIITPTSYIIDENGRKVKAPTYNELKQSKVSENYNTGVGKFLGDATYNMSKILGSQAINAVTGGVGGTALYWSDMFFDNYHSSVRDGHDNNNAMAYALASTAAEYLTGKFLGSATKQLTGGKTNEYEKLLDKVFTKFISNKNVTTFLSNASSEATEEFIQEYLDNINKNLILGENNKVFSLDTLADAAYSAGLGAISGGTIGVLNSKIYGETPDTNVIPNDISENIEEKKFKINSSSNITENEKNINTNDTKTSIDSKIDINTEIENITNEINEYQQLRRENKLTSKQEQYLNQLKQKLNELQNTNTYIESSSPTRQVLPTVQDIVNQEQMAKNTSINLPVDNQQSNITNSDKTILPTVNDFNSSNINMPTSNIKVDMAKIKPEILEDIKGFKLGDPSIESYKGSYIKTMLNEVGIKVPNAMNYVSEVRPDMSFTTTKDLTRQQYSSIGNALQKLRSIDVTSVNNANYSIPIGRYEYVRSNNVNINELRRTASMYLNNTAKTNNTIRLLENIIKDKNYIIRFNPNITNEQGVPVNGLITKENGKTIIELNPNADNYVEFLVIHEITHDIATKEMKELILDYAKQDPEFEKSLESLKERYKTNDVSDEVVADVCGELFGNREFIQSVVEKKPNIFKKILNNIRKLAEKIKGTDTNEYVSFVENLKEMWEDAYYSNKSNLKKTEYHTNSDIINNIDKVLNNIKERTPVRLRDYTPDILVQNGVKDLPMYENPSHIRKNILTENEARKLGLSINKNDHYHGLGKELYIKAIDSLDNPRVIFKRNNSNNYLILTTLKDNNGNNIVVPIEVETSTSVNNITIDINRLKSVYGYDRANPNLDKYIKDNIKSSEFTKIYEQKKKSSTGKIPQSTSTANNIPQSNNNVNSNISSATKYSIPINKNNTQELNNSSISFDNKGRKLSKEQQEYFKNSKVRDENGNLKVMYHGTKNDFTIFDINKSGKSSQNSKVGFWFTENSEGAEKFANNVWYGKNKEAKSMEVYLNIKNPKIYENIDNSAILEQLKKQSANIKKQKESIEEKYLIDSFNPNYSSYDGRLFLKYCGMYGSKYSSYTKEEMLEFIKEDYNINTNEKEYFNDVKKYSELIAKEKENERKRENLRYTDSYEQFRGDIYSIVGKDLYDANIGGTGIALNNESEIIEKYVSKLENDGYDGIAIKNTDYDTQTLGEKNTQYVAFYPNQIKNVDNTNPTSNKDIRYSQTTKEWNEYLKDNFPSAGTKTKMSDIKLPVREDISKNIELDYTPQDPTKESTYDEPEKLAEILKEKPNTIEEKDNWLKKLATIKFIDKGYYVDKLARKVKNKELSSKYDYSLLSNGIANQIIGNGRVDEKGNKVGKGLYEIFEPIENSGLLDEFSNYIYHKHNIDRMSLQNRFNEANKAIFGDGMTSEMSEKIVNEYETKYPEFESWADDIYEYNNANLEMLVKYGVLSKDSMEYYNKKYPHYVPTIREQTKTKTQMDFLLGKKASVNNPIKKAKGGNGNIIPLKDAMALRTMQTVNSALRNNFGLELLNSIETEQIRNQENVDNIIEEINSDELLAKSSETSPATLTVFDKGEKVTFDISDEIYEALKPSNIKTFKFLNKLNNIRRGLLTEYNPTFMITNPLKDIQDGSINSKHPKLFIKNLPEAIKQIKNNGQYKQLYIANGGSYETYFNYNTGTNIAPSKLDKIAPLKKISEINELIEMAPRLAEFISSIEAGDSIETAMYNASEITTNFKRGGDITKTLDRNGVTFLNAGVQGTTKQVRNVQEARVEGIKGITRLAVRWTIAGLVPTLLMNMIWGDDDDYEELSDYVKNNYYIIGKYDNGEFIRIPKGRVVSVLQSFFQNALNGVEGKKMDLKGFADLIENNLLPSDPNESSLIAPIKQAINNETWYGGDLVPTRLQNLPNAEQYDETTDSISIWLGKQLNISPYKINYVLDQYSGAIGDYILPYLTQEAESGNDSFTGKLIAPVKDKFTVDSTLKNQNISDFYSLSEKLTKKSNSSNATDEDILKNKYINSIKSEISKLYAEKREIQSSSSLKDSDKYNQSKELQKQINELSKTALNNYKNIEITDNYAIVGNKEYYKNSNDEWTKIDTESPKYKIANLITKYNNYLKYNDEIKNIKNQYDNSNTRKNAVIKYVNSLDLTIPQKAMLIKMNYSSYNNYNNQIISYVNNQKISLDEKKEILEELGFKVRNGKVYTK